MFDVGNRRRHLFILSGLLLAGFILGIFLARGMPGGRFLPGGDPDGVTQPPVAESRDRQVSPETEATVPEPVVGPDTAVVIRDYYPLCGEENRQVQRPSPEMIGMSRGLLATLERGGEILGFSSEQVEILRVHGFDEGDRFCREQARFRTLGIKDGVVTVFYGTRSGGPVKHATSIEVRQLTAADRQRLETGIVVKGDEEVLNQLEGMEQ